MTFLDELSATQETATELLKDAGKLYIDIVDAPGHCKAVFQKVGGLVRDASDLVNEHRNGGMAGVELSRR